MTHPYTYLINNIGKYSKVLKPEDIKQYKPNTFWISDTDFNIEKFLQDVQKETSVAPKEHAYLTASCADEEICFKPYKVYGFDNVLFYFANKK